MRFNETPVPGAFLIEIEPVEDERGFFARTFCRREFEARGLNPNLVQCSMSFSRRRATLRGMHYQTAPFQEAKLVRCTHGALYDVVLDLRDTSPCFGRSYGAELTQANRRMLYVPEGCAHGFLTLGADSEICYQISEFHNADHARGVRWNDPRFSIRWPFDPEVISDRDSSHPDYRP